MGSLGSCSWVINSCSSSSSSIAWLRLNKIFQPQHRRDRLSSVKKLKPEWRGWGGSRMKEIGISTVLLLQLDTTFFHLSPQLASGQPQAKIQCQRWCNCRSQELRRGGGRWGCYNASECSKKTVRINILFNQYASMSKGSHGLSPSHFLPQPVSKPHQQQQQDHSGRAGGRRGRGELRY